MCGGFAAAHSLHPFLPQTPVIPTAGRNPEGLDAVNLKKLVIGTERRNPEGLDAVNLN